MQRGGDSRRRDAEDRDVLCVLRHDDLLRVRLRVAADHPRGQLPGPGGGLGGRRHPRLHPRAGVQQLVRAGNSDCNQQSVAALLLTLNSTLS